MLSNGRLRVEAADVEGEIEFRRLRDDLRNVLNDVVSVLRRGMDIRHSVVLRQGGERLGLEERFELTVLGDDIDGSIHGSVGAFVVGRDG